MEITNLVFILFCVFDSSKLSHAKFSAGRNVIKLLLIKSYFISHFVLFSLSLLNLYVENGWCELLIPLLDTTDIDVEEKVIQAITLTFEACQIKYKSRQVDMTVLRKVLDQLNSRIKVEDDNEFKDYLQNLHTNLNNNVIKKLQN